MCGQAATNGRWLQERVVGDGPGTALLMTKLVMASLVRYPSCAYLPTGKSSKAGMKDAEDEEKQRYHATEVGSKVETSQYCSVSGMRMSMAQLGCVKWPSTNLTKGYDGLDEQAFLYAEQTVQLDVLLLSSQGGKQASTIFKEAAYGGNREFGE
jgi:hypothetical protein